jgi:DNA-directed RNA polymerase specialized sigma24 family protein
MKTSVKDDLTRALASLPREHRLVLMLSYADGLNIDEIAAVMRIGADQARLLLLDAVESLGVHLHPAPAA